MLPLIVVIDDDKDLSAYLKTLLREQDYAIKTAASGIDGLRLLEHAEPSLIILDLTLPDMNGEGLCIQIKKQYPSVPIIMLTAKDSVSDKIKGLNIGADDYITKPFDPDELSARVKARLRSSGQDTKSVLKIGDLSLDPQQLRVTRAGKEIQLTPQEFKLLEYLMNNPKIVLTRDMILNRVWLSSPDIETRVVDVYMGYLRKKIDSGYKKKLLHSIRGFGYTIKD